ncbi:TPA: DNA repair protein RadC [Escherichia albertii]|nr:DNA repair protein RadC [Escherichia albertii]EFB4472157.1 DNA repair protein RadC [Escherichia coli]EFB4475689.1 DNA repair protein RadC [Escherichia coli]HEB1530390.1 DNA repair protein RadC [Escherichia albertii]HEB1544473.1 DNA repair protein RadC [Escherichia albertii]
MSDTLLLPPPGLTLTAQRIIKRALKHLEKSLREPGVTLTSVTAMRDWLRLTLAGQEREVFMVFYLDNQHRLIDYETAFIGSVRYIDIQPREIVKSALRCNAAAVILAHNHPSGYAEPSRQDRLITKKLKSTLELVDVRILDHLVVGHNDIVSFAERGWL